ncbi:hypothetical protein [Rugamonas sp. DEMB1]|uniref:hypothetical protein n=1 Tax=Rugamonas sp. DEMB1 TaxID=3039386 RepID=UPI00244783A5|nr:hypothetical protein [Rugamonas sp. DEMB1]WGG52192.1 hypothetical protein QC826_08445 [Rugamonas sp. DEMB1]
MSKRAAPPTAAAPARARAGREAARRAEDSAAASDAQKQLHELQVSQIELELQQQVLAELLEQKDAAEAGLVRYTELYEQAPVGYLSLWPDGRISRANLAAAALLACPRDELLGRASSSSSRPSSRPGCAASSPAYTPAAPTACSRWACSPGRAAPAGCASRPMSSATAASAAWWSPTSATCTRARRRGGAPTRCSTA